MNSTAQLVYGLNFAKTRRAYWVQIPRHFDTMPYSVVLVKLMNAIGLSGSSRRAIEREGSIIDPNILKYVASSAQFYANIRRYFIFKQTTVLVKFSCRSTLYELDLCAFMVGLNSYNEHLRLSERYLKFDVPALKNAIATASDRSSSDTTTFSKLSEGGFNRIFQATFRDGNEVATLDYIRLHGIRTPEVYAYCSTKDNPVGAEYIIMEKLDGIPLGDIWYSMTTKEQHKVMKQIVEWETRLMSLEFPACGSLYYHKDLPSEKNISLSAQSEVGFCIGPVAHYRWWQGARCKLDIDRGPWLLPVDIFRPAGERELIWAKAYVKPRLPYERLYREMSNFSQVSPDSHIKNLSDYLTLVSSFKFRGRLSRPVMRHPDFQPNNILLSESKEVVGLIDWQHSPILPLGLASQMPRYFQNYGDPESESLEEPKLELPSDYDSLSHPEQIAVRETIRKRVVHYLYATLTSWLNPEHYNAIFNQSIIVRQRLFEFVGTPWEGNSITLQAELVNAALNWPMFFFSAECPAPLIKYLDKVIEDTSHLGAEQEEADTAMEQLREAVGVGVDGWVSNDDFEASKEKAQEAKAKLLEMCDNPLERTKFQDHFPFDDFDEEA